jgi:ribulose-phosphate 3-epimerase
VKEKKNMDLTQLAKSRTLVSPSVLAGDFGSLSESARRAQAAGADMLHVDVMDGHFVPNITFGPDAVAAMKKAVSIPLDVHLMISRPDVYAGKFIEAGSDYLTVHRESEHDMMSTLKKIWELGAVPGAVINPDTEVSAIEDVLSECGMVLVMSVFPGFGGQKFIKDVLLKVEKLRQLREKKKYCYLIEIDGGINAEHGKQAFAAGADVLVAGTYVYNSPDMKKAVESLKFSKNA